MSWYAACIGGFHDRGYGEDGLEVEFWNGQAGLNQRWKPN